MRIRRRNNFYVLALLFLIAVNCSNGPQHSIDFIVTPKFEEDSAKAYLVFDFASKKECQILLNWDALSVYDPSFEEEEILTKNEKLHEVLSKIQYTQFVIENQNSERRFFSDIQLFEGETTQMKTVFSLEQDVDTIQVMPNKKTSAVSESIGVNRLKIKPSDKVIRLHYLFKPTKEQKDAGFDAIILTSNWFKLIGK